MNEIEKLNEERIERLIFQNKGLAEKYVYYLLAVDAACVAFAIDQSKSLTLTEVQIPLGLAVYFWGASFIYGLIQIQKFERYITLNVIQLKLAVKKSYMNQEQFRELNSLDDKLGSYRYKQNLLFALGILSFIVWSVLRMHHNH
jgi:hypothetical protein